MTRMYLLTSSIGLAFVAFGYGIVPLTTMAPLLDVGFDNIDQFHIFRGVMGLYLGLAAFWGFCASRPQYGRAAVLSVVFFMTGLASGRILSMAVDGTPSPLLAGAAVVEVLAAVWGLVVLRQPTAS